MTAKCYMVGYTIHDGENEYTDQAVFESEEPDKRVHEYFGNFFGQGTETDEEQPDTYSEKKGYRILEVDSITEIPRDDYAVVERYMSKI